MHACRKPVSHQRRARTGFRPSQVWRNPAIDGIFHPTISGQILSSFHSTTFHHQTTMEQIAQKSTLMTNPEQRDPPKAAERGDKPARRRSHRPRGCRGGSNRRKNKGGENRSSFNKSRKGLTKKQGSFTNQRSSFNKGSNASEEILSTNNAKTNMGQQLGAYEYDRALSLQEFGVPQAEMFYSSEYHSSSSSGTDLQESLSESSEEGIQNLNTRSFHSDPNDMGLILPPMAVKRNHESEPVRFRGPNPYALHPTTNQNISDLRLPVYGMYNHGNAQGPEAHKMNHFYINGNVYSENLPHVGLLALNIPGMESKISQHVTKQHQQPRPVRGGGSLFCTSPRSFLMGNKKTDVVTRSE